MTGVARRRIARLTRVPRAGILKVLRDGEVSDVLPILVNGGLKVKRNRNSRLSNQTNISRVKFRDIKEVHEYVHKMAGIVYWTPLGEIIGQGPNITLKYERQNGEITEYPPNDLKTKYSR